MRIAIQREAGGLYNKAREGGLVRVSISPLRSSFGWFHSEEEGEGIKIRTTPLTPGFSLSHPGDAPFEFLTYQLGW